MIYTGKCEGIVTAERRAAARWLPRLFVVAGAPEVRRLTTQVHREPQCLGSRRHCRNVTTQAVGMLASSTWGGRRRPDFVVIQNRRTDDNVDSAGDKPH